MLTFLLETVECLLVLITTHDAGLINSLIMNFCWSWNTIVISEDQSFLLTISIYVNFLLYEYMISTHLVYSWAALSGRGRGRWELLVELPWFSLLWSSHWSASQLSQLAEYLQWYTVEQAVWTFQARIFGLQLLTSHMIRDSFTLNQRLFTLHFPIILNHCCRADQVQLCDFSCLILNKYLSI